MSRHERGSIAAAALSRLGIPSSDQECVRVHVAGASTAEGRTPKATREAFGSMTDDLASKGYVKEMHLVLVGPDVFRAYEETFVFEKNACGTMHLHVRHVPGYYHEANLGWIDLEEPPDVVLCFNAGLWGYDSWKETIAHIVRNLMVPLVVTSYSKEEAEDDEDALHQAGCLHWAWKAERCPYGTHELMETSPALGDVGEILSDSRYWQCVFPRQMSSTEEQTHLTVGE